MLSLSRTEASKIVGESSRILMSRDPEEGRSGSLSSALHNGIESLEFN